MKLRSIIFIMSMLVFAGSSLQAQVLVEPPVKILPTADRNVLKVHYAVETTSPLSVKFLTEKEGIVDQDKIKGNFQSGLSKRYDVARINDQDFWIEVASAEMTVKYHIVPSKDKSKFTSYLEKVTYNDDKVALNK